MKSKVASFTLHEILIVMIVSTIIIGIAFTVLTLVQRNMWAIQKNLSTSSELNKLEQSLWIDMNRYSNASFQESENKLVFESEVDSSVYHFNTGFITRARDTFNVEIKNKIFYFNGEVVSNIKIDALKLIFAKKYGNQQRFIFKRNDAIQFMN